MSVNKKSIRKKGLHSVTLGIIFLICLGILMLMTTRVKTSYSLGNITLNVNDGNVAVGTTMVPFLSIPIMVFGGIGAFIPALAAFFIIFVYLFFIATNVTYSVFIYLMALCVAFVLAKTGWFKTMKKTLAASVFFSVLAGSIWYLILQLLNAQGFSGFTVSGILLPLAETFPESLISALLIYWFYQKVPADKRAFVQLGDYSGNPYAKDQKGKAVKQRSRLSSKITIIIITEAVILGFSAAVFANRLLTKSASDIFQNSAQNQGVSMPVTTENGKTTWSTATQGYTGGQTISFEWNDASLAFDIRLIIMILNVAIPIVVFTDYFAQKFIVKPIDSMEKAVKQFTAAGTEEDMQKYAEAIHALKIHTRDEIEDLYGCVDAMVYSIRAYIERLKEEQKLQEDLRVAKEASKQKSAFLSNMSHEIRTPINAVLGLDEMILRESTEEDVLQYATDIENAGQILLGLVNDILDFSKMQAGKMEIIPVEYELSSTINDLVNMISVRAEAKHLELKIEVDDQIPHLLYGDEIRLKQVVTNILTNAVKYTPSGSVTMKIAFKKRDDQSIFLTVQVIDTGIGISEENMKKLFSPFERIEEKKNRSIEGTGLGMSIVKQLLQMMDSQLEVKSKCDEGSDFSFTIVQKVVSWEPMGDFTERYKKVAQNRKKYHEMFRAPQAVILVVDDTVMNLTVIRGLLKQTKIQIDTATSGKETLEKIGRKKYDIIFMDYRMPEMNGVETLQAMKKMEKNQNKDTPVIVLTANAIAGAREGYIRDGFSDYLSKPVESEKLEGMIKKYLPKERMETIKKEEGTTAPTEDKKGKQQQKIERLREKKQENGVDPDEGILHCGSEELYLEVLKEYIDTIKTKAADIQKFMEQKDYKNYTILVHGLKSSSRLIGAGHLAEKAAYLEACGDQNKEEQIQKRTPELLAEYRKLAELQSQKEESAPREAMPPEVFTEASAAIREFVEAFDFDSADEALKMLENYEIPQDDRERYEAVKAAIMAVDREKLLQIL